MSASRATHTPGSWQAEGNQINTERDGLVLGLGVVGLPHAGGKVLITHDEAAANCRLMAAGPALLAAVRSAINLIDYAGDQGIGWSDAGWQAESNDCMLALTAALAKATGGGSTSTEEATHG